MQVVTQIGFSNSMKESQKISAFINNVKVNWAKGPSGEYNGKFTTALSKRQSMAWFLAQNECQVDDVIRLEIFVFIRGMGYDEDRSRTVEWVVKEVPPIEYEIRKVGDSHFPLLYGPVEMIQSKCMIDDRRNEAASLIGNSDD